MSASDQIKYQQKSYSQFGEDAVLKWLFHGRTNGFYVDVGCHHPFRFSNTASLHQDAGWRGLNIDVDPRAIAAFNAERPDDINVLTGVAEASGMKELFFFEEGAINTFDAGSAAHPAWSHIPRERRLVDVRPLRDILDAHLPAGQMIDLLSIDAEGTDLEVLRSNDWDRYSPEVVLVEAHEIEVGSSVGNPTFDFMVKQGYRLVSHAALTSVFKKRSAVASGLTTEEIVWLYRCFLNRDPEDAATIARIKAETATFAEARQNLMNTAEFTMHLPAIPQVVYIPERQIKPMVKSKSRLALASIVKNEQKLVANMIRSCAPIVDFVGIIDTGSTDQTIDRARSVLTDLNIEHKIEESPFVTFSNARNAALALIPKDYDWIIMLDADEELVAEDLWRFQALLDNQDVDGWQLPRFNFSDVERRKPPTSYPDYQRRLFRNRHDDPVRFSGNVHEVPENVSRWGYAPQCAPDGTVVGGPHIHHLGYMDISQEHWQKKHDFYTGLREKEEGKGLVSEIVSHKE